RGFEQDTRNSPLSARSTRMTDKRVFIATWSPRLLSLMRIVVGLLFLQHGGQKLFGFPDAFPGGPPPMLSEIWVAGVLEFFGGLLIALGLFTRPVAFLLAGEMAVGYFQAHAKRGLWPLMNGGELAVFYCFVFLYLAVAGGGAWGIDSLWRRED